MSTGIALMAKLLPITILVYDLNFFIEVLFSVLICLTYGSEIHSLLLAQYLSDPLFLSISISISLSLSLICSLLMPLTLPSPQLMSKSDGLKNISANLLGGGLDDEERKNVDWVSTSYCRALT